MNHPYLTDKLIGSIRRLVQAHERYTAAKRSYFGDELLFMREAHLVIAVGTMKSPTMSDVAKVLHVTPGAVSQLAKRMEEKGFIVRRTGEEDKRQSCISLTAKGRDFFLQHRAYDTRKLEELRNALSKYSDEELETFITMQNEISQLFEDALQDPSL